MRHLTSWISPCLAAMLMIGLAGAEQTKKPVEKCDATGCGNHGTTIDFVGTPSDAATQAKKEGKLVFVLHVSGNFENPRFT